MKKTIAGGVAVLAGLMLAGCGANYAWRAQVPEAMRTVNVPTFRNESSLTELGSVMARQLGREFQREGTFAIKAQGEAALEIQGVVKSVGAGLLAYSRQQQSRVSASDFTADVVISVIDKRNHRVLVDEKPYVARTVYASGQDADTAMRDASGRLADDLARQVVDDILAMEL